MCPGSQGLQRFMLQADSTFNPNFHSYTNRKKKHFVRNIEQLKTFHNYKHFVPNYEQDVKDISQISNILNAI